jgi:methyltransferase
MAMSRVAYLLLLAAVGLGRLFELRLSRRNQRQLAARGARKIAEPHFPWMVALHSGILIFSALEVWLLRRPLIPALAVTMGVLFALSEALRWWVIATMSEHWNIQVMESARLGVVTRGPFRWIRHPNYVAVFLQLIALPLIHTAWLTAVCGTLAHVWVLRRRIAVEEAVLLANPAYRETMGLKPRFLPRLFRPADAPFEQTTNMKELER